jgi:hypothetical protein
VSTCDHGGMIPGSALSGSRRKRLGVGGFLTVFCCLIGLAMVVAGVASGLHERNNWPPVGMGCALLSCSYGFGRLTFASYTETGSRPAQAGGFIPWAAAFAFVIVALATAYHNGPS